MEVMGWLKVVNVFVRAENDRGVVVIREDEGEVFERNYKRKSGEKRKIV